jgi:phytoene synthase
MRESPETGPGIARDDLAACRALLRGGSRTFFAASMLLPARYRDPATALYAFCRLADDAVDLDRSAPRAAIARLRERLALVYAGRPSSSPADRAFCATIERFGIPRAFPEALIEGFAWDAEGRQYETLGDLIAYAARVAGTVGAMMSLVMGCRQSETVSRACELGIAMQLSNIARDVGEDARANRLYLPRQWLREAGIDPDRWLATPEFSPGLGLVVRRLLEAADQIYARSHAGIADLPFQCRPSMRAARFLYADIGRQVGLNGFDSVTRRAVVPGSRKLQLVAYSLVAPKRSDSDVLMPVLDEARFLIDAVARIPPRKHSDGRVAWLVDLFERLERRDRIKSGQSPEGLAPPPRRRHYRARRHAAQLQKVEC